MAEILPRTFEQEAALLPVKKWPLHGGIGNGRCRRSALRQALLRTRLSVSSLLAPLSLSLSLTVLPFTLLPVIGGRGRRLLFDAAVERRTLSPALSHTPLQPAPRSTSRSPLRPLCMYPASCSTSGLFSLSFSLQRPGEAGDTDRRALGEVAAAPVHDAALLAPHPRLSRLLSTAPLIILAVSPFLSPIVLALKRLRRLIEREQGRTGSSNGHTNNSNTTTGIGSQDVADTDEAAHDDALVDFPFPPQPSLALPRIAIAILPPARPFPPPDFTSLPEAARALARSFPNVWNMGQVDFYEIGNDFQTLDVVLEDGVRYVRQAGASASFTQRPTFTNCVPIRPTPHQPPSA